jgi:hypothetical protein
MERAVETESLPKLLLWALISTRGTKLRYWRRVFVAVKARFTIQKHN